MKDIKFIDENGKPFPHGEYDEGSGTLASDHKEPAVEVKTYYNKRTEGGILTKDGKNKFKISAGKGVIYEDGKPVEVTWDDSSGMIFRTSVKVTPKES